VSHLDIVADAIAALPAAHMGVKPLEWGDYMNRALAGPDVAVAHVSFVAPVIYQVQRDPHSNGYMAFAYPKNGTECWSSKGHVDLDAAKSAAQADYEARILAALEPAPALAPTLGDALDSILKDRADIFDIMVDTAEITYNQGVSFNVIIGRSLRAAIAALQKKGGA
jgi:hypothetical protein